MSKRSSSMRDKMRTRIKATKSNCHICGRPIDYTLPHTDRMSFVVDHVIALAKGGADDMSNAAAAHRTCNSTKRARDYAPIIRRSGSLDT